jgi:mannosyl-oligosaccharide glucosidase
MLFLSSLSAALLTAFLFVAAADDTAIVYKEIARSSNQSLLWGPYRPNLYFGVRPRIPKSLMGGLMWSKVENFQDVQNSECLTVVT